MVQTLTFITDFWRNLARARLRVSIEIDHGVPGPHLIWTITNTGDQPVKLSRLLVRGRNGSAETVALGLPHVLAPADDLVLPTDADWSLLTARSVAAVDVDGREYAAPARQLAAVRDRMRQSIDRPAIRLSAPDFLSGAADLVFGVVILGLGFFMLLYAFAAG